MSVDENGTIRRERLVHYLLGESTEKECLEVEKLCNQEKDWIRDKILLTQSVSLLTEALDQSNAEFKPSNLKLNNEQRQDIFLVTGEKPNKTGIQNQELENASNKKTILSPFIAIGVGVIVFLIAYCGTLERENKEKASFEEKEAIVQIEPVKKIDFLEDSNLTKKTAGRLDSGIYFPIREDLNFSTNSVSPNEVFLSAVNSSTIIEKEISSVSITESTGTMGREEVIKLSELLMRESTCYLLSVKGDSLGKISLSYRSWEELVIERTEWQNRERIFGLSEGSYEIRMEQTSGIVLILKGFLTKNILNKKDLPTYLFSIQRLWKLDSDETRTAVGLINDNP